MAGPQGGIPTDPVIDGDPFGHIKKAKSKRYPAPEEVNEFHTRSDCDTADIAKHHTLGIKHNQASFGDHVHDGVNSRKLMDGVSITGDRSTGEALNNLLNALETHLGITNNTIA